MKQTEALGKPGAFVFLGVGGRTDSTLDGYDVKGNRTLVRDSEGVETGYTYDSLDRLETATTPLGTATYGYFEDGLLKQTDYRNGLIEERGYDAAGRLTTLETAASGVLVSRFEYAFDADGNRVRQVETRQQSAGEETTYGYDEAGRLIGVAYPSETHLYRLDAVGNRTGEKRLAQVLTPLTVALFAAFTPAQATAAVERQHNAVDWVTAVVDVKASTTTALTSDANGNRTAEGARRYRWDIRDTLTQVEDGASVVGTYDYDAKLQRVKADTAQGHVEYVLDGKYVLREAGARQRRYHFGEGEALAVTGVGGTGAQDRWLHTDALGSVVTETDATASSVTARQFDAWGNYRHGTAPGVGETRLGYTGHQYDVETGLTYARARYYDSKLGVFLSRDSFEGVLTEAPSLHRYTYAHNNPLRYTDPSGRAGTDTAGELVSEVCSASPGSPGCATPAEFVADVGSAQAKGAAAGLATGLAAYAALELGVVGALAEGGLALGRAGLWTARTIAGGFKFGAPAGARTFALGLAGETAADLGSLGLNAYQCAQGDQTSCAGAIASAVDAAIPFSASGDLGGARALSKVKTPKFGGEPVVGQESATTPATKLDASGSSTTTYYHGTNDQGAESVRRRIDLTKGDGLQDFDPTGRSSFYVTKDRAQAERWALRTARDRGGKPAVVSFEVPDAQLQSLQGRVFPDKPTREWSGFVRKSRSGADPDHHDYDFVEGPLNTSTEDSRKIMSARQLSGRGHQMALCTDAASCVFDAAKKQVDILEPE